MGRDGPYTLIGWDTVYTNIRNFISSTEVTDFITLYHWCCHDLKGSTENG